MEQWTNRTLTHVHFDSRWMANLTQVPFPTWKFYFYNCFFVLKTRSFYGNGRHFTCNYLAWNTERAEQHFETFLNWVNEKKIGRAWPPTSAAPMLACLLAYFIQQVPALQLFLKTISGTNYNLIEPCYCWSDIWETIFTHKKTFISSLLLNWTTLNTIKLKSWPWI